MMFFLPEGSETTTFEKDNDAPDLPLPTLDQTLERYFESLRPFGTEAQLKNSRKIIDNFRNDIGAKLHKVLQQRTRTHRNWVEKWWEDYAYCTDRTPILPFAAMASELPSAITDMPVSKEYALKGLARVWYHSIEFWDALRHERIRPATNPSGTQVFSSFLLRRIFNTCRLPGEVMDTIVSNFRTIREGGAATHFVVIGRGRMFRVDAVNEDGSILREQQLLAIFEQIRAIVDGSELDCPVPVLTCANRTAWAAVSKNNYFDITLLGNKIDFFLNYDRRRKYNKITI